MSRAREITEFQLQGFLGPNGEAPSTLYVVYQLRDTATSIANSHPRRHKVVDTRALVDVAAAVWAACEKYASSDVTLSDVSMTVVVGVTPRCDAGCIMVDGIASATPKVRRPFSFQLPFDDALFATALKISKRCFRDVREAAKLL